VDSILANAKIGCAGSVALIFNEPVMRKTEEGDRIIK
jgi:hypothetical protein